MIIATIAVGIQINFMLNMDLGFTTESIISFSSPWYENNSKKDVLKHELDQIPQIETISLHGDPPSSNSYSSSVFEFYNGKEIIKTKVFFKYGDTTYFSLYNIKILAGRKPIPVDPAREIIINETYMRQLGFTNPNDVVGQIVNTNLTIVGVMKDFHARSLHTPIEPIVFEFNVNRASYFGIKISSRVKGTSQLAPIIEKIKNAWGKIYPDQKFEYHFLDDTIKRFYETEQRTALLTRIATMIAILISCLGLFGLSSYTVLQRTKEIGIRKVLGATVNSIVVLLSKEFIILVLMAFVISAPLAWYATDYWLKDFAYKIEINAWLFIISGCISVAAAFLTITARTIGAAKADPVASLRYE